MQLPTAVVMVRPASFGFNPDTAPSFLFQREITDNSRKEIERRARMEFDILEGRLKDAGVDVIIVDDKEELHTPDAVFSNNWVSFRCVTGWDRMWQHSLRPFPAKSRRGHTRMKVTRRVLRQT